MRRASVLVSLSARYLQHSTLGWRAGRSSETELGLQFAEFSNAPAGLVWPRRGAPWVKRAPPDLDKIGCSKRCILPHVDIASPMLHGHSYACAVSSGYHATQAHNPDPERRIACNPQLGRLTVFAPDPLEAQKHHEVVRRQLGPVTWRSLLGSRM